MADDYKETIRSNLTFLIGELEVTDPMDYLCEKKIFSWDHVERVRHEATSKDKARLFLDILKCRGPQGFEEFLVAVRKSQPHIADRLEGSKAATCSSEGRPLQNLSIQELVAWLEPELKKKEINEKNVLPIVLEEKINGETFAEMNNNQIKDIFPDLTFGERLRLAALQKNSLKGIVSPPKLHKPVQEEGFDSEDLATTQKEYFRKFDQLPGMTDKYYRGSTMEDFQRRPGNLLDPVHQCVHIRTQSPNEMLDMIGKETVEFASACMNDRTNGIIHFGIGDGKPGSPPLGEVVGILVEKKACEEAILQWMTDCFCDDQLGIAVRCIREAKFIDVINRGNNTANLVVVEIDVSPSSGLVGDAAFFLKPPKSDGAKELKLFTNRKGAVEPMNQRDLMKFMEMRPNLTHQRKEKEREQKQKKKDRNLREKIIDHLNRGSDKFSSDLYHILVANEFDKVPSNEEMKESFGFLERIDWRCIFDFDASSSSTGLYNFLAQEQKIVYKIKTTDDFDSKKEGESSASEIEDAFEDMKTSYQNSWVFCNGDKSQGIEGMDVGKWELERAEGFKECLRFFYKEFPQDRAVVVFLLLSKNYEVMMETAKEFMLKFPNQWVVIAETEAVAREWIAHVLKTVRQVTAEMVEDKCIIGYPWADINNVVKSLCGAELHPDDCQLPSSIGAEVVLSKQKRQMWFDLVIVGPSECRIDETQAPEDLQTRQEEEENKFYTGHEASWWNFFYKDQVLTRDCYQTLVKLVREALDATEVDFNRCFNTVTIYHQPGSGGTTLAKNVLWDLRREYRCCVLPRISKSSAKQIIEFREFSERDDVDLKPVLVLIDNPDDESLDMLMDSLRQLARDQGIQDLVCTLVLCCRRAALLPQDLDRKKILLEQKVSPAEKQWFLRKYDLLMGKYKKGKGQGIHPDMLLLLNIMKENYDKEATRRTVAEFVKATKTYQERTLLKNISMLNSYDVKFRGVPVPFFDQLMGRQMHSRRWETGLSSHVRLFLVFFQKPYVGGYTMCLRTSSSLLSRHIFDAVLEEEGQMLAGAFEEFLHLPILKLPWKTLPIIEVFAIIKTILRQREWLPALTHFSRLIQELYDKHQVDAAAAVLKMGFEITGDPMIAQQIARLYIRCQNWEEALQYAEEATRRSPNNSYLWDTHGQISKAQLAEVQKSSKGGVRKEMLLDAVKFAYEAVRKFRKVQYLSRAENTFPPNTSGHFGELDSVRSLLEILRSVPDLHDRPSMASFMQTQRIPDELKCLPLNMIGWLKKIKDEVFVTLRGLEDEASRANAENYACNRRAFMILQSRDLDRMHAQLCKHLGEEPLKDLSGIERMDAQTRRRHAFQLRGVSLNSMLRQMREGEEQGVQNSQIVLELMRLNLRGSSKEQQDLSMGLISSVALISWQNYARLPMEYEDLLHWSREYYSCGEPDLNRFLFMVMLHWPTDARTEALRPGYLEPIPVLWRAVAEWQQEHQKKCPSDSLRQEDSRPLFFLTQHPGLESIVHVDFLKRMMGTTKKSTGKHKQMQQGIFRSKWARQHLQRFRGILLKQGMEVEVEMKTADGNTIRKNLPIFQRETNALLWRKHVFLVLGFCLSGPMAFDISEEDPGRRDSNPSSSSPRFRHSSGFCQQEENLSAKDLKIKLLELENLNLRMAQGHTPSVEERQLLQQERHLRQQARPT